MNEEDSKRLLKGLITGLSGNIDVENNKNLDNILPFWYKNKLIGNFEKNDLIRECILKADQNGYHVYNYNRGFVIVVSFPKNEMKIRTHLLDRFFESIGDENNYGGKNALQYLVSELVDNIYQHSHFSHAYLGVEQFDDFFYVCVCDDGVTIRESLRKVQPNIKTGRDALLKALQGVSSKNKERGWGLSSVINIARNGYHAEILVASSDGALWMKDDSQKIFNLEDESYPGTLLEFHMTLPLKEVDIYDYI
ncbi:MAG TPA: ATP-binding protein [Candidatus Thermoplasmatota archaeon]|nr:ATP-binding protein [Candidatus Thermoplasmatota archaeon]